MPKKTKEKKISKFDQLKKLFPDVPEAMLSQVNTLLKNGYRAFRTSREGSATNWGFFTPAGCASLAYAKLTRCAHFCEGGMLLNDNMDADLMAEEAREAAHYMLQLAALLDE